MRRGWKLGLWALFAWMSMGVAQAASCQLTTPSFNLGSYNTYDTLSATATGQMTVACTATTPTEQTTGVVATVSLSAGSTGNQLDRALVLGMDQLHYNVYLDPNLTTIFGDGTQGTQNIQTCQDGGSCTANSLTVPLYAAAPPHQDVGPGAYQDSLVLNVIF